MATLSREAERLDVVFSDLIMPGEQDGLDLARAIRRQWPQLPVILATGFNEAATSDGGCEFPLLAKPYEAQAIRRAVQDALHASRARPNRPAGYAVVQGGWPLAGDASPVGVGDRLSGRADVP